MPVGHLHFLGKNVCSVSKTSVRAMIPLKPLGNDYLFHPRHSLTRGSITPIHTSCSSYTDTSRIGFKGPLYSVWPHFNKLNLQRPYFQEVPGVRTSAYPFGGKNSAQKQEEKRGELTIKGSLGKPSSWAS